MGDGGGLGPLSELCVVPNKPFFVGCALPDDDLCGCVGVCFFLAFFPAVSFVKGVKVSKCEGLNKFCAVMMMMAAILSVFYDLDLGHERTTTSPPWKNYSTVSYMSD